LATEVLENRMQGLANRFLASPPQRVACSSVTEANDEDGFELPIMKGEIGGDFFQHLETRTIGGRHVSYETVTTTPSDHGQRLETVDGLDRERGHYSGPVISGYVPFGVAL
jgi:hypothetical protein